jgi:hypothetical protein
LEKDLFVAAAVVTAAATYEVITQRINLLEVQEKQHTRYIKEEEEELARKADNDNDDLVEEKKKKKKSKSKTKTKKKKKKTPAASLDVFKNVSPYKTILHKYIFQL